jgi:hypothetical protein
MLQNADWKTIFWDEVEAYNIFFYRNLGNERVSAQTFKKVGPVTITIGRSQCYSMPTFLG